MSLRQPAFTRPSDEEQRGTTMRVLAELSDAAKDDSGLRLHLADGICSNHLGFHFSLRQNFLATRLPDVGLQTMRVHINRLWASVLHQTRLKALRALV